MISLTGRKEIVLWNLAEEVIVTRLPVASDNAWSWLAEGGAVVLTSTLASGIPSAYLDVENTAGRILFSVHTGEFAWSSAGFLAYCGIEGRYSQRLSLWDGREAWVVAVVSYRPVQWQYGTGTFSCNNG